MGDPGGTAAFITFENATNCWVKHLGFVGAGIFQAADLGRDAVNKKAIYWKVGNPGATINCGVQDCYFERIEGEVIYADGVASRPIKGLTLTHNHFKQCLSNCLNVGIATFDSGFNISMDDNIIEDCGGSPCQTGGSNTTFCRNKVTVPSGLFLNSTNVLFVNAKAGKIEDNIFDGINLKLSGTEIISVGFFFDSNTSDISIQRNLFRKCAVLGNAGNRPAMITVSASTNGFSTQGIIIKHNDFIECFDALHGSFPDSCAIRFMGSNPISAVVEANHIDNRAVSNGLRTVITINSEVSTSNGIIVKDHTYDSTVSLPFIFNVSPAFTGSNLPTGASANVLDTTYAGPPDGYVVADKGSTCRDTNNGVLYIKNTGTGNTGWSLLASTGATVPTSRTLTGTAPITIAGDNNAHDLSVNRTIGISNATTSNVGVIKLSQDIGGTGLLPTILGLTGTTGTVAMHGSKILWDSSGPSVEVANLSNNGTLALKVNQVGEVVALYESSSLIQYTGWNSGAPYTRLAPNATTATYSVLMDQGTSLGYRVQVTGTTPVGILLDADDIYFRQGASTNKGRLNNIGLRLGDGQNATDRFELLDGYIAWDRFSPLAKLYQHDQISNSANGTQLIIQAQNSTGFTTTGGNLILQSGTGTSASGNVIIKNGTTSALTLSPNTITIPTATTLQYTSSGPFVSTRDSGLGLNLGVSTTNNSIAFLDISNIIAFFTWNSGNPYLQQYNGTGFRIISTGGDLSLISSSASTNITFSPANTQKAIITSGGLMRIGDATTPTDNLEIALGNVSWDKTITTPKIYQKDNTTNSATGTSLTLQAQNATGTTANGGALLLTSGTGTSLNGQTRLRIGSVDILAELSNIASGQRIVALNRGVAITTTEMPTNTGDLVAFVGNAATNPTANPVSGYIQYSSGGAPFRRHADGTVD